MGIYILPSTGDAYDWLRNHDATQVPPDFVVKTYNDYRALNVVPICVMISVGVCAAVACSLEEAIRWIECGRYQEWYLVNRSDLEDDAGLSSKLINDMLGFEQ